MKQRAVILSLYFKSGKKKTFPALFNVIVTKNYSLGACYSDMLSES